VADVVFNKGKYNIYRNPLDVFAEITEKLYPLLPTGSGCESCGQRQPAEYREKSDTHIGIATHNHYSQ